MKNVQYYIKILRPINLVILAITQIVLKYAIFDYEFHQNNLESKWSIPHFFLFVLVTLIITASGNVINDYFDQNTDQFHIYKNNIIGRYISPSKILFYYFSLVVFGGILAVYLAIEMDFLAYLYFYPLTVFCLYFYSKRLKSSVLIGNLLISLFISLSCLVIWLLDYHVYLNLLDINPIAANKQKNLICGLAIVVFLINLSREIVKDIEDVKEDKISGIHTTAVVLGVEKSKRIALVVQYLLLLFLLIWSICSHFSVYSYIYLMMVLTPLLLLQIYKTIKASEQRAYNKASSLHKIVMGTGLMYIILNLYSI